MNTTTSRTFESFAELKAFDISETKRKMAEVKATLAKKGKRLKKFVPDEQRYYVADNDNEAAVAATDYTLDQLYASEVAGADDEYEHIYLSSNYDPAWLSCIRDGNGEFWLYMNDRGDDKECRICVDEWSDLFEIGKRFIEAGIRLQKMKGANHG